MSQIDQAPQTRHSLILRLRKQDDVRAWRDFVEIYEPVVRAMARKRGLQAADVDDVTQEVLTRVAKAIEDWNPDPARGSFRGWLATITRNLVVQFFRQRGRLPATGHESQINSLPDEQEYDLESERQLFLWAARKVQPRFEPATWQAFWLTAVDGENVNVVADRLQTTKAQIHVSRSRVMSLLKETIQRTQFDSCDGTGNLMSERECPTDSLPLLIQDELSFDKSSEVLNHLEDCASCQRQLETLSAEETWWERANRGLSGVELDANGQLPRDSGASSSVEVRLDEDLSNDSSELSSLGATVLLDPPAHPEMLGRIDEFDIEEKIGQGGMGVVFRGFDRALNRPVAVKVMAPHLGANGVARQRFAREAQAAAAVVHPHVVPIYRVSSSVERPYIAMAFVDGQSLQEKISEKGPLEIKDVIRVSIQIADGLAAAHRQGLIHRDIKPANILMEKGVSRVMISDFGLARAVDDVAMTQSGCLAGTPHYMSPEQVTGEDLDHRSDLFSVGSVMYFIATGREPFRADSAFAVINKITCDVPSPPQQVNDDIPETLSRIIGRLLEKNATDRIQSAGELQQLLTEYLAHLQDPQHHAPPQVKATRSERLRVFRRIGWVLALAGLLGLFGWASVFLSGDSLGTTNGHGSEAHGLGDSDQHSREHHDKQENGHAPSHH